MPNPISKPFEAGRYDSRNLKKKILLDCSPFGRHNTRQLVSDEGTVCEGRNYFVDVVENIFTIIEKVTKKPNVTLVT